MGHQDVVVDSIKELFQIKFHTPTVTRSHMGASGFDGLMGESENSGSAAQAAGYRLGHRRIGLIKGPQISPLTQDRVAGYQAALDQAGITSDPAIICHGELSLRAAL
jgi:DNA-binding LacI/PurR family transcriptional regulator